MTDSAPLIGIDLGTTNSLCAVFVDGAPKLIPNAHGGVLTPSVVGLLEDGHLMVGAAAKELAVTKPERTASWFKRWMGTDREIEVAGKKFSAQELSSLVLRSLAEDAAAYLGHKVTRAVITVPAYFNDHQREATRIAAQLANLDVQRIINEPTAAALTYGLIDKDEDKKILVVDLGGGTFDVTLMEVFEGTLEIVSTAGESHLGGEDFTDRIVDWCLRKVDRVLELAELKEPLRVARLRQQVELAKRSFTDAAQATIVIPQVDGTMDETCDRIELTREQFDQVVDPLMKRLERPMARALQDGRTTHEEVDEVILVGGATRMPTLRNFVTKWFGKEPRCHLDPDEVVAKGAAVQAALIADDKSVEDMVMTDVCPFTLGIEITKEFGTQRRDGYFLPVIHRNTTIPVSREEIVHTMDANQRQMNVRVFQGEGRKVDDNLLLGEFEVDGIPPMGKGAPVAVRFTYDLNGLLEVEAMIEKTGKKFSSVFTHNVQNLSQREIEKATSSLQKLKFYPREDADNQKLLLFAERIVGQVGLYDRPNLEEAVDLYEAAMRGNDKEMFAACRQQILTALSSLGFPYSSEDS